MSISTAFEVGKSPWLHWQALLAARKGCISVSTLFLTLWWSGAGIAGAIGSGIEQSLQQTSLELGPDCEPNNFSTKLWLKTLNDAQVKRFWLGQRYAVERYYSNELKRQQLAAVNEVADSRIAEIEAQRTDATLAALGVRPKPLPPSVVESIARSSRNTDQLLSQIDNLRKQGSYNFFVKCYRYADDRSK